MLTVKTYIDKSNIEGIGIFANQFIPAGTIVWVYSKKLDITFTPEELAGLTSQSQEQVKKYSYFSNSLNAYILCGDDARFFNHSDDCNCSDAQEFITRAKKDIKIGEEITCNYAELDSKFDKSELT